VQKGEWRLSARGRRLAAGKIRQRPLVKKMQWALDPPGMLRKRRAVGWKGTELEKKRTLPTQVVGGRRPLLRGISTAAARARAAAPPPPTGAGECRHGTGCHSRVPLRPSFAA